MDWSYIAGFFDGEGNFHMVFTKRSIQMVCRIYGDSEMAFKEMIKYMGFGKIYYRNGGERVPEINIHKKEEVKKFLENIIPHLVLKKAMAEFILENYDFGRNNNLDFNREKFYSFVRRKNVVRSKDNEKNIINRKTYLQKQNPEGPVYRHNNP